MKELYETPETEIIHLLTEDVITQSGDSNGDDNGGFGNYNEGGGW